MPTNRTRRFANALKLTVTDGGTNSGDPCVCGTVSGIALEAKDTSNRTVVARTGAFRVSVAGVNDSGDTVITAGDPVFYVSGDTPVLSAKSSGVHFGWAIEDVTSGAIEATQVALSGGASPVPTAGTGTVDSVVAGINVTVDNTDPANPIVSAAADIDSTPSGLFDVTDPAYGAVGDGSTDDTAAINLAIAALNTNNGGELRFPQPASYYKITGPLTTITKNASITGDTGAKISGTVAAAAAFMTLGNNCTMRGLQFDIDDSGGDVIKLTGDNVQVRNCFFSGGAHLNTVHITGNACKVSDNYFNLTNQTNCIYVDSGFFTDVGFNTFRGIVGAGPLIAVAANTTNFGITGNLNGGGGSPTVGVSVAAGTSDHYVITGNDFGSITAVTDGGTGVNKTVNDNPTRTSTGGGLTSWFDVTDVAYGATGDGVTDDTAAINAAIAAVNANNGGVLFFPKGTYLATALTTITVAAVVMGVGSDATSGGSTLSSFATTWTLDGEVTVRDIGFFNMGGIFALTLASSNVAVENCNFTACDGCVRMNAINGSVRDNIMSSCRVTGTGALIYINNIGCRADDNVFSGCRSESAANDALIGLFVAAACEASICGNISTAASHINNGIYVDAVAADKYIIVGNNIRTAATASVNDNGTGTNKQVALNL